MAKREPKVKVGDVIDKLTVIEKVNIPIKTQKQDKDGNMHEELTGKTKVGWLCECECGGTITLPESTLLTKRSSLRSCDKCPPEKNVNYIPKKMTFEDNQDWEELYEYVKKNIYGYEDGQLLPKLMTSRLLGISRGKYIANNKSVNNADYSYKTILNTFKFCSTDIQKALRTNKFVDEQHKTNYVLKIIEKNINDVYIRMKNLEKAKEEAKNTMVEISTHVGAEFKPREKKKDKFADLW